MDKIQLYEELALNAHPALQTQIYDGWILRYANGYTNRANSINPLYPSTLDLDIKINECKAFYAAQGLPPVHKLTDGSDPAIDRALSGHGYKKVMPTLVMEMDLPVNDYLSEDCIITDHADSDWLDSYISFSHYTDSTAISTAKLILEQVRNTMICGRIVKNGLSVACALAVIERGFVGLLNIVIDEPQRGNGYGEEICRSLLTKARRLGAHTAYLQVVKENQKAVNLYTKLGFKTVYSYGYRI